MEFDICKFSEDFKIIIEWMQNGIYSEKIKNDLNYFKNNRNILNTHVDSPIALRKIIELIVTKSGRLKKAKDFDTSMDSFISKYGNNFRNIEAKKELLNLFNKYQKQLEQLLNTYSSLKSFTEHLYDFAKQGKTVVMGEKGRDNYLRDFGYFDRIPMDRHQKRFIVRTGIYHACSIKMKSDVLQNDHLHYALTRFCSHYLKGFRVNGIDLGNAPGIVDTFIWSYSSDERYTICSIEPNCEICKLNSSCLYSLMSELR